MNAFISTQKLAKTATGNLEAFQSLADMIFGASERLLALNLNASRDFFSQVTSSMAPVTEADLHDHFAARIAAQGKSIEQTAEYFRNVTELFIQTQHEVSAYSTQQLEEASRTFTEFLEHLPLSAPEGNADFVAAMKAVMSNASATYEKFVQTTRDVAQAGLAAGATAKASKKAA